MANILLTGPPGCGKTTVLRRLVGLLPAGTVAGFLTEEIREGRARTGFLARVIGGPAVVLAEARPGGSHRVGRYRVDTRAFEEHVLGSLAGALRDPAVRYLVVDEIGKMEFLAPAFAGFITAWLDDPRPLVASVVWRPHPEADRIKERPDVEIVTITGADRDLLPARLAARLLARGAGAPGGHRAQGPPGPEGRAPPGQAPENPRRKNTRR